MTPVKTNNTKEFTVKLDELQRDYLGDMLADYKRQMADWDAKFAANPDDNEADDAGASCSWYIEVLETIIAAYDAK
jgi:hypothetical protein